MSDAKLPLIHKAPVEGLEIHVARTGLAIGDSARLDRLSDGRIGVFARLRRINPVIAGEDAGLVIFDFASGASGLFDGNRLVDHPANDTRMTNGVLLVEGNEGVIRLDGHGKLFLRPRGGEEREHAYAWQDRGYGGDCVYGQARHVVDHIVAGTPLVNSGRDYLRNLEIEEAVYRSAAEGRFIEL